MAFKHVPAPLKGMITNIPSTLLPPEASPYIRGMYLRDGEIRSDFGHTDFPVTGDTATNMLNGTVMIIDQFFKADGLGYLYAFTTTNAYWFDGTTWQCITQGIEIDDCEAQWDAQSNVVSTADTTVYLRDSKSAKHVIDGDFGTDIISSEDDLQNTNISAATNTHVVFWIRASENVAAGVLRLRLSEQATGGTGATYADLAIPALLADTWTHVAIDGDDMVAGSGTWPDDFNALASVALVANSDPGEVTIYLDDIRTAQCFTGDEDNRFSTAMMNDTFIVTNGIDQPQKITVSSGVHTMADLDTSLASGDISTSAIVFSFKDHLFLMNNTEGSPAADCPQRVTWSNIGHVDETDAWKSGTAGYQDLVDDESWVIAVEQIGENEVIIYKERSIVKMMWVGGHTPFRFWTMVTGTGTVSEGGVANVGGEHIVFGPDVVYAYKGGTEIEILDDVIKRTMYDRINKEYVNRAFLLYVEEDDELQIWIPTKTLRGTITAFADGGGGQVTVTSAAHGLTNGASVTIIGTTSYNGTFTIANVGIDTFEITDTWVANGETGSWTSGTSYPDDVWCMDVSKKPEIWYRKRRTMMGFGYYEEQSSFTIGDLVGTIGEQHWRFGDALTKKYTPITLVGDTNGKVYKLDKMTLNNDGTAITNEFQTPDFVLPDTEDYMNKFMRVPQLVFEARGQSVTTHWSDNGGHSWNPTSGDGINTVSLASTYDVYQQDFDATVRKIRFRFRNVSASSGFRLRYYGFYWMLRSGRK